MFWFKWCESVLIQKMLKHCGSMLVTIALTGSMNTHFTTACIKRETFFFFTISITNSLHVKTCAMSSNFKIFVCIGNKLPYCHAITLALSVRQRARLLIQIDEVALWTVCVWCVNSCHIPLACCHHRITHLHLGLIAIES